MEEAYKDRVIAPAQGQAPTVRFGCEALASRPAVPVFGSAGAVTVRGSAASSPVIGELFRWESPREPAIPVVVRGALPHEVLLSDARNILSRNGYNVTPAADTAGIFLDVAFAEFGVRSTPAGWTELRGTITARTGILAAASKDGKILWKEYFVATEERKVAYFLTSDMEATLNQAYCKALEKLMDAISAPAFAALVRDHAN